MLDHAAFASLRLSQVFSPPELEAYPFFAALGNNHDTEFLGGAWHEELIDGVQFFYAEQGGSLGVVEVWGGACVMNSAVRDPAQPDTGIFMPKWRGNADRVLAALDAPFRLGAEESALKELAAGEVLRFDYPDGWYALHCALARGSVGSLSFALRVPDIYHVSAVVHGEAGLLKLVLRHPVVVRRNDREGAYDSCFAEMHDEGS